MHRAQNVFAARDRVKYHSSANLLGLFYWKVAVRNQMLILSSSSFRKGALKGALPHSWPAGQLASLLTIYSVAEWHITWRLGCWLCVVLHPPWCTMALWWADVNQLGAPS